MVTGADQSLRQWQFVGAWLVLLAVTTALFGTVWDVQWHTDVGPDTFLTLPHLLIYFGAALDGLVSLAIVLRCTRVERGGPDFGAGLPGSTVTVLGHFRAPVGYLICGTGAAGGLLYGLVDLWWHTVYGFDAVFGSPPHVALFLSAQCELVGCFVIFAGFTDRRAGRWGLAAVTAAIPASSTFLLLAVPPLPWVNTLVLASVLVGVGTLVVFAGVVRSPVWIAVSGGLFVLIQAGSWLFGPPATRWYAGVVGLPLRDFVTGEPVALGVFPALVSVFALVLAGCIALARRTAASPKVALPLIAAGVAVLASVAYETQVTAVLDDSIRLTTATTVVGAVLGGAIGWLGWSAAAVLRRLNSTREA